jgi:ribonuclease P protein component
MPPHEKDVSTIQKKATRKTWISRQDKNARRAGSYSPTAQEGPETLNPRLVLSSVQDSSQKTHRTNYRNFFSRVFKKGKSFRGKSLAIWIDHEPEEAVRGSHSGVCLMGIQAARTAEPKATRRNLWKRRVREAMRMFQREIPPACRIVIQMRKQKNVASYQEIESELADLLKRAGILK